MVMKILEPEIISRETIKPSSPTPHHLKSYKLSMLDQISPTMLVPIVFFYQCKECNNPDKLCQIKKSLSEILTYYYPLAGRINDQVSIDCNDEGVHFYKAQFKCKLSQILERPEMEMLNLFFPELDRGNMLVAQVSFFECGGMALGVCISHKIADAATLSTFMNDWANMAFHPGKKMSPELTASSVFPPSKQMTFQETEFEKGSCVTRRFVFNGPNLTALKAMSAGSGVENPTRVELVTALICKCATDASRANSSTLLPTFLTQAVNLRKRMIPPLPDNTFGNISWLFPVSMIEESKIEFHGLIRGLKEGISNFKKMEALSFRGDKWFSVICQAMKDATVFFDIDNNINLYKCSSWCTLPFYQVDFGWGRPIWTCTAAGFGFKNALVLMDTGTGDGIEALMTLDEKDMALFERNEDLLTFASFNPSALGTD